MHALLRGGDVSAPHIAAGRRFFALDCVLVGAALDLSLILLLEVSLNEEVAEEDTIAAVHAQGEDDVGDADVAAFSVVKHLCGVEVNSDTCEHLSDLEGGNANGDELGGSLAGCAQRVVTVHDSVDEVVDSAEPSACCDWVSVAVPAVHKHGDVMIPVKEDKTLLPQYDEDSVTQLRQLAEHE